MLVNLILNTAVLFIGAIFSWLPAVETLPNIGGYDIDTALVTGVAQLYLFMDTFWYLQTIMSGFLFLMGYYAIKIGVRFFLGSRSPW